MRDEAPIFTLLLKSCAHSGRLSSLSSHRSSIPPQSSPELFLEPEKDVEFAVSLVLQSQAMMQTDGFEYLKENCPTILIEILEYVARVSEHFVIQHQHGNEA
nr:btb/poz and math domain-containing protein 1 [Quercus suber]